MNKYISFMILVLALVLLLKLSDGKIPHPVTPAVDAVEECKESEKFSDNDYYKLIKDTQPRTKAMKCFHACFNEKSGQVVDTKMNLEGILNIAKLFPLYSQKHEKNVTEIVSECQNIQDADRCELSDKLNNCFMDGAKKRGIEKVFAL